MNRSTRSRNLHGGLAVAVGLLCILSVVHAAAADDLWKVGLAEVKITPDQPVFMAGYSSRNKPFEKVETDLFAKAMALEDGKG